MKRTLLTKLLLPFFFALYTQKGVGINNANKVTMKKKPEDVILTEILRVGLLRAQVEKSKEILLLLDVEAKEGNNNDLTVCKDSMWNRLRCLQNMTIAIRGLLHQGSETTRPCVAVHDFKIERAASGRVPLVGVLNVDENKNFFVQDDMGRREYIETLPKGLRELQGHKVIVDVRSTGPLDQKLVVNYWEFP